MESERCKRGAREIPATVRGPGQGTENLEDIAGGGTETKSGDAGERGETGPGVRGEPQAGQQSRGLLIEDVGGKGPGDITATLCDFCN